MNLTESRRGALFAVLDDPEAVGQLVSPADMLDHASPDGLQDGITSKDQLHYLLRDKSVFDVPPTVLENIARIDGAVVLCPDGTLKSFGAILHHPSDESITRTVEGGRTTAAIAASQYGVVLKISEDGLISMYRGGVCQWEL